MSKSVTLSSIQLKQLGKRWNEIAINTHGAALLGGVCTSGEVVAVVIELVLSYFASIENAAIWRTAAATVTTALGTISFGFMSEAAFKRSENFYRRADELQTRQEAYAAKQIDELATSVNAAALRGRVTPRRSFPHIQYP